MKKYFVFTSSDGLDFYDTEAAAAREAGVSLARARLAAAEEDGDWNITEGDIFWGEIREYARERKYNAKTYFELVKP